LPSDRRMACSVVSGITASQLAKFVPHCRLSATKLAYRSRSQTRIALSDGAETSKSQKRRRVRDSRFVGEIVEQRTIRPISLHLHDQPAADSLQPRAVREAWPPHERRRIVVVFFVKLARLVKRGR